MGMTINDIKSVLRYYFKTGLTPFIWSKHGAGKSQSLQQLADELNFKLLDMRLGQMEVGDVMGLPVIGKTTAGETITEYAMPKWLKIALEGNCIILWDEINRAKIDVIQAVFQAVLDKKMHLFEFPATTFQVCAGNPNNDDYIVTDIADAAFMSRFGHISLVPSALDWVRYAESKSFHPSVTELVKINPAMFGEYECPLPVELNVNPRAFEFVSNFAKLTEATADLSFLGNKLEPLSFKLFQEITKGILGMKATVAYFEQYRALEKPIPAKDILEDYSKVQKKVLEYSGKASGTIDANKIKQDLLKVTVDGVVAELFKNKVAEHPQKYLDNLFKFLNDMPNELSFSIYQLLGKHEDHGDDWLTIFMRDPELSQRIIAMADKVESKELAK